jgi:hypothetical protein
LETGISWPLPTLKEVSQERLVKLWESFASRLKLGHIKTIAGSGIQYRSSAANVYHCCVHKTGSQWIRMIVSDPVVQRYSGLKPYHYQSNLPGKRDGRDIRARTFTDPFPTGTIISPLYISFENFEGIPKPELYKAFFVQRDPRDIVISRYFERRKALSSMSFDEGIVHIMDDLHRSGHFQALESWINASKGDRNTKVVRFEDLIGPFNRDIFDALLKHCDICMPRNILDRLLTKYSFEALTGRQQGEEKKESHYRKGISGDWKTYFNEALIARFHELTGNLAPRLGYSDILD